MTSYVPVGPEFDVNSTFARSQVQADGAQLADGRAILTWVDADFSTTADRFIRAQIYQPDGTPTGTELTLVSGSAFINPAVTGLADGGFVVTWQDLFGIRAQVFDSHGAAVAPVFAVSPTIANSIAPPDVAALDTGGFAIVWNDNRSSGADVSGSGVHLRAYDAAGAPLGPDRLVNVATAGNQADSSVTALHDGHYVVTWTDNGARGSGAPSLIKGRIFDADGTPHGSEFVVDPGASGSLESSVTTLANGNFAVAWEGSDALGSGHHIQVFNTSGTAVGSEITVPQSLVGIQVGPKLVGLSDGGFAIAWTANYAPQSDGSGKAVFVQVFDADSHAAGGPMQVNTQANGDQFDPALTAIAGGGFIISWTDLNGPGADDDQVKAQIFQPLRPVAITSDGGGDSAAIAVDENHTLVSQVVVTGGQSVAYAIDGGADAALFTIDAVTGVLRFANAPDYEAPAGDGDNIYVVRVRASDAYSSDTQTLTVTVHDVNETPVISSHGGGDSATLTVMENSVAVGTVVASDPEGTAASYSIVGGADAAKFTIDAATGALTFVAAPDYEAPADANGDNHYEVVVAASDGTLADTQTLTITVGNVNEAPVVSGGDAATLTVMENTNFVGAVVASDPDGTAATYSIVGGADAAKFTIDAATGALTFVAAPDYEAPTDADGDNHYEVVVAASDGTLADTQTLTVSVGNVNEAPVISGGDTATLTVMENSVAVGTVVASDPEGTAATYSIVGGADAAQFTIDAATGALTFVTAPDYEAPADADGDNHYEVVVAASDGTLAETQTLTVTVGNVNEAPVISGGDAATLTAMENTVVVGAVVANDPDGTAATYSIVGGADAGKFTIDAATGALTFVAAPDYEAPADADGDNHYEVVVAASDGALTDTQTLTVIVGNVNEAPVISSNGGGDAATLTIMENTVVVGAVVASDPDGTAATYSIVGGADASKFTIDAATGALAFVTAPDYEAPADADGDNRYEVVVAASDGTFADTQTLTVAVGNVNEAPVISSNGGGDTATLTVMENSVVVGTVAASDPDGTTATYSIVGGADAARFTIDAATGAVTFVAAPDYEAPADANGDNRYEVVVAASDGTLQDTQALTITVGNVNEAPVISSNGGGATATLTVTENTNFVGIMAASDPEGTTPTYSIIGGADAGKFAIDAVTGTLKFLAAPDYEAPADANHDNHYEVVIAASDGVLEDTQALSVAIGNVADGLTINGGGGPDVLNGTNAEDVINGLGGNDVVNGLGGADTINGGAGNDTLSGGDGDDVFLVGTGAGVDSVDGGAGTDSIIALADSVTIGLSAVSGVEAISANGHWGVKIAGSTASDTLDFSGTTLSGITSIDGGSGNDIITGSSGDDVILGSAGNDQLSGGAGNDVFQIGAGAGVDAVDGGAGNDEIIAQGDGVTIGLSAVSGIEKIISIGYSGVKIAGSTADDTLDFSGTALSGIASIDGGSGNDIITGSSGDDVILGSAGNDVLSGGGSNDTLTGGAGSDQLGGGAGADLFVYAALADSKGTSIDTIMDFQSIEGDRIDLSAIDANSKVAGDQAFTWIGDSAFHRIAGELRQGIGADGYVHVYGDTSGDGKADFELILRGTTQLAASDFIL